MSFGVHRTVYMRVSNADAYVINKVTLTKISCLYGMSVID